MRAEWSPADSGTPWLRRIRFELVIAEIHGVAVDEAAAHVDLLQVHGAVQLPEEGSAARLCECRPAARRRRRASR